MPALAGKIALITGIAGGQGRAAAQLFAAAGAHVVGCDINDNGTAETVSLVRAGGGSIEGHAPVDLTDQDAARTWIDRAVADQGGLDVLYNNASAQRFAPVAEMAADDWRFTIDAELNLIFYATQAAWPHLVRRGGGAVVNTGSVAAYTGSRGLPSSAHAAAKAGVIAFTRQLAVEGAPHGIRANSISPGLIRTPVTEAFLAAASPARPRPSCRPFRWDGQGERRKWPGWRCSWPATMRPT